MFIVKHIPNIITLCNLLCGCIGIIYLQPGDSGLEIALVEKLTVASYLIYLAVIFDFLDGFVARLLHVKSEMGKELDSLADVVTFGVLPGFMLFKIVDFQSGLHPWLPYLTLIVPLAAAYRLAKFNIDTRQNDSFLGLPTPAMALLVSSIPFAFNMFIPHSVVENPYVYVVVSILLSLLMVSELPLFALKFASYKLSQNIIRYSFLACSALLICFCGLWTLSIIIVLYVILSIINLFLPKKI